ncbi:MAG: sulfatase-like hydrolase/transferase [Bacteroidota bacterium]
MSRFKGIRKALSWWFSIPWYPLIFSAYPVLALLSINRGQVEPSAGVRGLLVSLLLACLLFLLFRLIFRQTHRAAFFTLLLLLLFFSYGHVYDLIEEKFPDFKLTPWLLGAWVILALLGIWWTTRRRLTFASSAMSLNVVALGLVLMAGYQAFSGTAQAGGHRAAAEHAPIQQLKAPAGQPLPDVYYFILDSYGREDLFRQAYKYDNSGFISGLQKRGFYVAACSQSNYVRTEVSVASSLNMLYLQDLDSSFKPESQARGRLWDSLKHSAVRYNFESMGYKTVGFASGFAWMELRDAAKFYSPPPLSAGMTEFEGLFLRTTLARYAKDLGWLDSDAIMGQNFRDRFRMIFNTLDDIARDPAPTFAYVHVISPHPPFVFGPNGEQTYPPDFWNAQRMYPADLYAKGYQNQLTYLNKQVLAGIDAILKNSPTPPIIIIQGDHGPWLQPTNKRFWILNAYYLPGHQDRLYPTISPVNSFRLVFDEYFGGDYPLLKDVSYFSPVPNLYEFSESPNPCEQ